MEDFPILVASMMVGQTLRRATKTVVSGPTAEVKTAVNKDLIRTQSHLNRFSNALYCSLSE